MITSRLPIFLFFILPGFVSPTPVYSQSTADSVFYNQSLAGLSAIYRKEMASGSRLYTGSEYLGNGQRAKGSPFYLSDSPLAGSVIYQGQHYEGVDIQYDLLLGALIIKDYSHNVNIELTKQQVERFTIAQHEFHFITPDHISATTMEPDYYERLNAAPPFLFARRFKKIVIPANPEEVAFYQEADAYYMQMADRFYPVSSKSGLINLFKDKKEAVKKYIKDQHLNFNKDFEQALIRTIEYYGQIRNSNG